MKKTIYSLSILLALCFGLPSCEEWEPVLGNQGEPDEPAAVTLTPNTTIKDLKALYTKSGNPVHIESDLIIGGQVISSDASGNVYRSLYIQDATGGIEIKIGRTGLYNDYKLGQWIYVKCNGLTLGNYEGMLQLGMRDPTGSYETAYLDVQYLIDLHVFKGEKAAAVSPKEIGESNLKNSTYFGTYVTIKGLTYGKEIFCLWYPDSNGDTKSQSDRVFLSGKTWGVTTWAMSARKMKAYVNSGIWDTATLGDKSATVAQLRAAGKIDYAAYSVSQYFKMGSTDVQVRSSGYSKFADTEIPAEVLSGAVKVNLTGILTSYNGAPQFTLVDLGGVETVN